MMNRYTAAILVCLLLLAGCRGQGEQAIIDDVEIAGTWRGFLNSPGGDLPFFIEVERQNGSYSARVINGPERLAVPVFERSGRDLQFGFPHYDSFITCRTDSTGEFLLGTWNRRAPGGEQTNMQFGAVLNVERRFEAVDVEKTEEDLSVAGEWDVTFADSGGSFPAQGVFEQDGEKVTGTFLTETGDYRFLAGSLQGRLLQLSVFDGAHAFLFKATLQEDGSLVGDFWSRDSYHATWTATRGTAELGDPYELTSLRPGSETFDFAFPNAEGEMISSDDPQFDDKALIVTVFGTWCPNCNDEVPLLKELYSEYADDGLEIVGLANEFAPDFAGRAEMVRAFAQRYDISWPLLIVGSSDKSETLEALEHLESFTSYPTTLFINRDGSVRAIHTGFTGPGTGKKYDKLKAEFHALAKNIVAQ